MATTLVIKENASLSQDVNQFGTVVDSSIVLATALLAAGSPLQQTKVIEIQMEYESDATQAIIFEYSTDKGATWLPYNSKVVAPTTGPAIMFARKTLTHHNIQLRIRSTVLGKLRVLSFVPRIVLESKVNP